MGTLLKMAVENNAIAIRGMFYHSGAIKEDGSIVLWGTNSDGQLAVPDDLTSTNLINADLTNAIVPECASVVDQALALISLASLDFDTSKSELGAVVPMPTFPS